MTHHILAFTSEVVHLVTDWDGVQGTEYATVEEVGNDWVSVRPFNSEDFITVGNHPTANANMWIVRL